MKALPRSFNDSGPFSSLAIMAFCVWMSFDTGVSDAARVGGVVGCLCGNSEAMKCFNRSIAAPEFCVFFYLKAARCELMADHISVRWGYS